jgi:hypothetical protein
MAQNLILNNPFLNAITYEYCFNLPTETIKNLPIKYRRMLASTNKTKTFCTRSTIDERIIFFHYIGINFGLTIFPDKVKSAVELRKILELYEEEKKSAAQKEQSLVRVFVTTDKETAHNLSVMGQTSNHETYIKALDFNKVAFTLHGWDKELNSPFQKELLEVYKNADYVLETLLNASILMTSSSELLSINKVQLQILMFLFTKRHTYIKRTDVLEYFMGMTTAAKLAASFKKLILNEYVRKHADWSRGEFTISTAGIKLVNDYISQVFKANKFL